MIYAGPDRPAIAMIADFRIEQLMDKLVDNAVDFHRKGTAIRVQLDCFAETLQISVSNRGPVMSEPVLKSAFDSMVSHRGPQNRLHFGLGLYVVRVIADYHGGVAKAVNLPDASGVAMIVQLPLAETEARLDAIRP
jgi:K+-sensing histidine kinase KdpD